MALLLRTCLVSLICASVLATAGCLTTGRNDFEPHLARFYLEESAKLPASHIVDMVLPISGSHITVRSKPVFAEWDVLHAVAVETEFGPALLFMFKPEAANDLYRTTISNQGRRLVLTINGMPVGAHYLERPIQDGRVLFFLEVEDSQIPRIAEGLQKTVGAIQDRLKREEQW